MKVTFDIECTPEEARKFLGLPDVVPMQEALMKDLQERMRENMSGLDSEAMMKSWFPAGVQSWNEIQKAFWTQMGVTPPSMASKHEATAKSSGDDSGEMSS